MRVAPPVLFTIARALAVFFAFLSILMVWSEDAEDAEAKGHPAVATILTKHSSDRRDDSNLPPILFVSRNTVTSNGQTVLADLPGFGPRLRTIAVGGRLMIRESNGALRVVVDTTRLFDVADPDVGWNGETILFSGLVHPDSNWRIFRINADGGEFRQLTFTDRAIDLSQFGTAAPAFGRYDDFDPCWLPDGRIVLASTRHPSVASIGEFLTSNLYVMNADGSDLHRITSERNGGEEPTIDPTTGKIVYARWWLNVDLPSNATRTGLARDPRQILTTDNGNVWHAGTIRPDGNELTMYAGFPRTRFGSQTYKPAVMNDGTLLSTFTPHTSLTQRIGGTGIRWFRKGADFERYITGVKSDESLRSAPHVAPPYATDAMQLKGTTLLISYSTDGADFGIYHIGLDGRQLQKLVDFPGTHELEPHPVQARPVPPKLEDQYPQPVSTLPPTEDPLTYYRTDAFRFDCMNIYINGNVDEPMPDAPKVTHKARIRFFMNIQRQNRAFPDPSILVKEVPVFPSGGVHEPDVPADVPLFEQIVDSTGKVLQTSSGKFAHVPGFNFERIGGGTKCAGCHAGHSMLVVPINQTVAEWFNASTSANVTASSVLAEGAKSLYFPQRVVDRQAQTGGDTVNWVSAEREGASVRLSWEIPLDVKEFVLYNIKQNSKVGTSIRVQDCEIVLHRGSEVVGRIASTGRLTERGITVPLPLTTIDAATITVTHFTGTFHRQRVAGIAEVETIARISQSYHHLTNEE